MSSDPRTHTLGPLYQRRYHPYYQQYDDYDEEEIEAHASHTRAGVALIAAIIIVVAIVIFVIWWVKKSKEDAEQRQTTCPLVLPKKEDGTVLIAEGGHCATSADCRNGLICHEGICRTPETVARVQRASKTNSSSTQRKEVTQQTKIPEDLRLKEFTQTVLLYHPKKEPEPSPEDASLEEAREMGIPNTLRPSSAVSDADQDFSY